MTSKHILITGAAGFIGYHLALALKARGDHVIGLDNFNDYYDPSLKRERAKLLALQGIHVDEGDVCDAPLLLKLMTEKSFTHIVHLAAQAGVRYSLVNPQAYIKANIDGFLSILEVCRQFPSVPLIYASSSSVYGTNIKTPFAVEDRTDAQASLYGVTKKTNELMAYTYHHLYDIRVTGLRFFTVYGPWGRPDMAYFSFTKAILEDKPIDVYHFGHMKRDFTYIDDIVSGVIAALDLSAPCEIFNLGNHRPEPLSALISAIEESLGKKAIMRHLPIQPGDVEATYADIESSYQKLGFQPKVSLHEGIRKFVQWYINLIK
ncbi:MAG: NAD-dependent epimerase/dehydratase family protein [Parachlamydiaceae bacterium]|nr:NAD-dependent epimerase/dehydratase family protein [Parachlamydiaceae bacterium]